MKLKNHKTWYANTIDTTPEKYTIDTTPEKYTIDATPEKYTIDATPKKGPLCSHSPPWEAHCWGL